MSNNIGAEVISIRYQVMADEEIKVGGIYTYVAENGFYTYVWILVNALFMVIPAIVVFIVGFIIGRRH